MKKILYILVLITFVLCIDKINAYTEYKIGDIVPYNGMDFYVIKDSGSKDDSVTMLKAEPLTVDEVNLYGGVGTENNHVNRYTHSSVGTAYNRNGYGGVEYYASETCRYVNGNYVYTGCKNDYESSEIKYVVDSWKAAKAQTATEARLITINEVSSLGYEWVDYGSIAGWEKTENAPSWLYNNKYWYWTMSQYNDSKYDVWDIGSNGGLGSSCVICNSTNHVVRPVITVSKTILEHADGSAIDNEKESDNKSVVNNTNETKTTVKVDNTYMSSSILLIILGFIIASISVLIIYKFSNKKK